MTQRTHLIWIHRWDSWIGALSYNSTHFGMYIITTQYTCWHVLMTLTTHVIRMSERWYWHTLKMDRMRSSTGGLIGGDGWMTKLVAALATFGTCLVGWLVDWIDWLIGLVDESAIWLTDGSQPFNGGKWTQRHQRNGWKQLNRVRSGKISRSLCWSIEWMGNGGANQMYRSIIMIWNMMGATRDWRGMGRRRVSELVSEWVRWRIIFFKSNE